jgi:hypothetical protein
MANASQQGPYVVPAKRSIMIGRYTLDVAESVLVCGNEKISLRPQVLRVIEAVTTSGGKVPRKGLGTAIWGADAPDRLLGNALDQVISDVRGTLMATPDLRLERGANGYWLKVLDLERPSATKLPGPGDKFPLDYLLEPHVRLANCELTELRCMIAGPEALEFMPRFARASFEHMAAGARIQMLLPAMQIGKIGRLLFQLIAGDLLDDGKQADVLQDRFNRLIRNFRVSIVDDALFHMRIYCGGMDRDTIATLLPTGINEGVVYSQGIEASLLHQSLQAKVLPFGPAMMIGLGGTMKPAALEELRASVYDQFHRYDFIARQAMGCCGWGLVPSQSSGSAPTA